MPKKIDLTGKTFGRLQVIKQAENIRTPNGRSHVAWECLCECGKITIARGDSYVMGMLYPAVVRRKKFCHKQEEIEQAI